MNRQEGREGPEREGESGGQGVTQEPTTCKIVSKCSKDMHKLFVGLSLISQFLKMLQHPSATLSLSLHSYTPIM